MRGISHQRCLNHTFREAAARCPECKNYFCRECVTEHAARVVCAACLARLGAQAGRKNGFGVFRRLRALLLCGLSFLWLWFVFYGAGRLLLTIPSEFHDGTLWEAAVWQVD